MEQPRYIFDDELIGASALVALCGAKIGRFLLCTWNLTHQPGQTRKSPLGFC